MHLRRPNYLKEKCSNDRFIDLYSRNGGKMPQVPDNDNYIIYGKDDNQPVRTLSYFYSCSATMPTNDLLVCESNEFGGELKVVCAPISDNQYTQNNIIRHETSGVFTRNYLSTNNCPTKRVEKVEKVVSSTRELHINKLYKFV